MLVETCLEISKRHEINFLEIGMDKDYVLFPVQSVPTMLPGQIMKIIKGVTRREIFRLHPEVKRALWGGIYGVPDNFVSMVGKHGNESQIKNYVQEQGKEYVQKHRGQISLFDL